MDVQHPTRWYFQDVLSKDLSICDNDHNFGRKPCKTFEKIRIAQSRRLEHRQANCLRCDLHR